ncbi:Gti1/Pac2 family-domain-containing protein [Dactylonectria macrodidyma]|uniref:Gti1/Pac2 family-domain-containing protein n=1 Tax=Dactylonectria macrodidyma TaxID=307937 RepID=A0A9P9D6P2_9HYPO|nr:Gti1/Pac2 family-domain-containing protein [Dactylonectria macrodidyma]
MAMASSSSPLNPTFQGYVESTLDALILFEACLSGQLTHVPRRPHGNVFIYEEHASGIKRWTDGILWSPSRILGNFLIYRELEKPFSPGKKKRALMKSKKCQQGIKKTATPSRPAIGFPSAMNANAAGKDTERALIGSLIDLYPFKDDGLIKKTISVSFQGVPHHLVSYYNVNDVMAGRLITPTKHPDLTSVIPRSELHVNYSTDE